MSDCHISRCLPAASRAIQDAHVGKDSTGGRLHHCHLTCPGGFSEHTLRFRLIFGIASKLEDFDSVSHLFPPDARDTKGFSCRPQHLCTDTSRT